jgi:hypothetical protein
MALRINRQRQSRWLVSGASLGIALGSSWSTFLLRRIDRPCGRHPAGSRDGAIGPNVAARGGGFGQLNVAAGQCGLGKGPPSRVSHSRFRAANDPTVAPAQGREAA